VELHYIERCRIDAHCEDAVSYEVVEYQLVVTHVVDSSRRKSKSGLVYRLADGRDVHWVNNALFQIVESGKLLQRSAVNEKHL
jgi:hypothetical protein